MKIEDIYRAMKNAGVEISSHESDMYCPVNDCTKKIVKAYTYKGNVTVFHNQTDNALWYDVPFAYQPWWNKRIK